MKRGVEVDPGKKVRKEFALTKGQTYHWQAWNGGGPGEGGPTGGGSGGSGGQLLNPQMNSIVSQTTTSPPNIAVSQVTFRKAQSLVPCYPIKTFEHDDPVVHMLKRGDIVREQGGWIDHDRRCKLQHSHRRDPKRALWSLQPEH
eukprot:COSAG01_NODE_43389_length_430_cov_0.939577_1_plen_143_part_11